MQERSLLHISDCVRAPLRDDEGLYDNRGASKDHLTAQQKEVGRAKLAEVVESQFKDVAGPYVVENHAAVLDPLDKPVVVDGRQGCTIAELPSGGRPKSHPPPYALAELLCVH